MPAWLPRAGGRAGQTLGTLVLCFGKKSQPFLRVLSSTPSFRGENCSSIQGPRAACSNRFGQPVSSVQLVVCTRSLNTEEGVSSLVPGGKGQRI